MDGFKNSTRVQYMKGGACEGYAKGGSVKGAAKINKVMGEFKRGELHSGSKKGPEVKNPKQAVAIAMSEARKAGAKMPVKKARGGMMDEGVSTRPTTASGRRMTNEELGMTPGGVDPAKKKAMPKGMGAMSDRDMEQMKADAKKLMGAKRPAAGASLADREVGMLRKKAGMGAMSDRDMEMLRKKAMPKAMSDLERARTMVTRPLPMKKGGVPAHSDRPLIRRSKGGLSAMPKGKC